MEGLVCSLLKKKKSNVYGTWLKMFTTSSDLVMGNKRLISIFMFCIGAES